MRRWSSVIAGTGFVTLLATALQPTSSDAALLGDTLKIVNSTPNIVTGDTWQVTAEVDDFLGSPAPNTVIYVGIKEPLTACGTDLTANACTGLATVQKSSDASGRLALSQPASLDTFVVLYLSDSSGALDPTTGQSVSIRTHNEYDWSGPADATLQQLTIGTTPYMVPPSQPGSAHRIATGTGAAGAPRTEVSGDGGDPMSTVARGFKGGAFPLTLGSGIATGQVNFIASKPGTYSLRVVDSGGAYEDPGTSQVVTVTVTARTIPKWLSRTNEYRSSLGLSPIAESPAYDAAIANHVRWMVLNKQLSHSEPAGSKGYTVAGNQAAEASDLAYGHPTPSLSVDGWIGAPFHASCLLKAAWAVGGFAFQNGWAGEYCHSSLITLDLATGTTGPIATTLRQNYTFPSATMKVPTTILHNANEAPDPIAGCATLRSSRAWSVPILFRVAKPPTSDRALKRATATLKTKSGRRLAGTCLLTPSRYVGSDLATTQIGRLILGDRVTGRWAVLLAKAGTIRPGLTYTASLFDGKFSQRTTFTVG